ncbi:hypothetical protein N7468_008480 [Penicillium chermesinum]|uniref:Cytochrome P450 n=1 Tax=Penicillium chermesinum TaxID=63820 RepID=A0A9W9TIH8_9EURO|nr:uncharacterized protein N7468_008480 [Penicillium chermesinum]KAJ5223938.1 hypothetical protein N7468_008480 [Penicillium chermesinum]KAJ6155241.1 hypothetical protein N7470_005807 [Penicillium chermesinum]
MSPEEIPKLSLLALVPILLVIGLYYVLTWTPKSDLPFINARRTWEIGTSCAQRRYMTNAAALIKSGLDQGGLFRIITDVGVRTMLSPKYANEIRSNPDLSLTDNLTTELHVNLPGFEPFRVTARENLIQDTVRTKITQNLASAMDPLSREATYVLQTQWTDATEWHDMQLKPAILKMVAQLSSRIFLGDRLCRDPKWLDISINYTVNAFTAAQELRLLPEFLRPFAVRYLPTSRKTQRQLKEARKLIAVVLKERRAAQRVGDNPEYIDAIQWLEDTAKGRKYDPAAAQLALSAAAIHTTTDLFTQTLLDICGRDDLIRDLREEIITVVKAEGWKKTTLYKLKLMDSVIKECQRLKPMAIAIMARVARRDVVLHDGKVIPKGDRILVSCDRMWNEDIYPDPLTFDPYRFARMRNIEDPKNEAAAQLVSPSPDHMGFGFGQHACPGRFFVANEIKIALCHILLKYDIKLAAGCEPKVRKFGMRLAADPTASVSIRRRREEITL